MNIKISLSLSLNIFLLADYDSDGSVYASGTVYEFDSDNLTG